MPAEQAGTLWAGFGDAWTAVGYLLCGMVVWGGVGYLADKWLGTDPILTIVGVLLGHAGGIYLVWMRAFPRPERKGSSGRAP